MDNLFLPTPSHTNGRHGASITICHIMASYSNFNDERNFRNVAYIQFSSKTISKSLTLSSGRSSLVVKVSDCGWLVTSSSPVPLKTRHGVEWGKIIGLQEGGFSYRAIGARVQRNSSTVMRVWKLWTDEHRTTRKTGSKRWKVVSACDDRHLLHMTVNDRTASSR
ncbi:uncharacterized protein TNCV_39291 [Trichonephila clavipes]|nr:uncharacterized protein TNCV_39291 [Trichonephila clavipes]